MALKQATVRDIMSAPIVSIKTNETVNEAIDKLNGKGAVKVIISSPDEKAIGYTDIWKLRLSKQKDKKIEDILNRKESGLFYSHVYRVTLDTPLKEVINKLLQTDVLVVNNDKGDDIGVITPQDIRKVKETDVVL